jgi:WD40 repeat protein
MTVEDGQNAGPSGGGDWGRNHARRIPGGFNAPRSDIASLGPGGRKEFAHAKSHANWVSGVAITPDGRRAISASWDGSLRIWDLENGQSLLTLQGRTATVSAVAITGGTSRSLGVLGHDPAGVGLGERSKPAQAKGPQP